LELNISDIPDNLIAHSLRSKVKLAASLEHWVAQTKHSVIKSDARPLERET